eukprot:GHVN01093892.1.p1 GENE.GHVN01093892.1~~GHVN01093892.1.p1  ORF type:complete len:976 (-),score=98.41 GHVN01093892.1:303-3053(-)
MKSGLVSMVVKEAKSESSPFAHVYYGDIFYCVGAHAEAAITAVSGKMVEAPDGNSYTVTFQSIGAISNVQDFHSEANRTIISQYINSAVVKAIKKDGLNIIGRKNDRILTNIQDQGSMTMGKRDVGGTSKFVFYKGFSKAIEKTEKGYMLIIDAAPRLICNRTMKDELQAIGRNEPVPEMIDRRVKNLVVMDVYASNVYTVLGVAYDVGPNSTFSNHKTKQEITYVQYLKERYNFEVHDENGPMVRCVSAKGGRGEAYIPAEALKIVNTKTEQLSEDVRQQVTRLSQKKPNDRWSETLKLRDVLCDHPNAVKVMEEFGLQLGASPTHIEAKNRQADIVIAGSKRSADGWTIPVTGSGEFTRDFAGQRSGCRISQRGENIGSHWMLVENSGPGSRFNSRDFCKLLHDSTQHWKWPLASEPGIQISIDDRDRGRDILQKLDDGLKQYGRKCQGKPKLVILLKSRKDNKEDYIMFKKWCWQQQIPSQAVTKGVLEKFHLNSFWKVGVQMVAKLNTSASPAVPWELETNPYDSTGRMIIAVGISLYDAKSQCTNFQPTCAIVGTRDKGCGQVVSHCGVAEAPSGRVMVNLEHHFEQFWRSFRNSVSDKNPMGLVIYRLGVPENEEGVLRNEEIRAIHRVIEADIGQITFDVKSQRLTIRHKDLPESEIGKPCKVKFWYYDKKKAEAGSTRLGAVEREMYVADATLSEVTLDEPPSFDEHGVQTGWGNHGAKAEIVLNVPEHVVPEVTTKAFQIMGLGSDPIFIRWRTKVTFINVTKGNSNNLRFYKDAQGGGAGIVSNMDAGTIIDSGVRRTIDGKPAHEFWLMASNPSLGTPAPAHYSVIENGLGWDMELLEISTLKLCNMYYNWTGVIRVPHVVKLADKLAEQVATVYTDTSYDGGSKEEAVRMMEGPNILKNTMVSL